MKNLSDQKATIAQVFATEHTNPLTLLDLVPALSAGKPFANVI
jgi:hypothetical protein